MRFINKTKNTVVVGDIDLVVPYIEDEPQSIDADLVKKSDNFRLLVKLGQFQIVEHDDTVFEKNLTKMQDQYKTPIKKVEVKEKSPEKDSAIEVKIRGHMYEAGGYAKVNRNLALGLNKLGCKIQLDPVNKASNNLEESEIRILNKVNKTVSRSAIVIDSMIPTFSNMSGGAYRILYTTIEASSIPQQFVDICNNYNEIWVASDFCKEVLNKYNIQRPIYVIPDSININDYQPTGDKFTFNPPLGSFAFLSVFGWSYRKGYDLLLKAYLREFSSQDDVSLLLATRVNYNTNKNSEIKKTIKDYIKRYAPENAPHISLYSNIIPESNMASLYRSADAFALFSRGEGFGLPYCEASLCGIPVIATNHSGQTMFLKNNNSYLIDIDSVSPLQQGLMDVHYWDEQLFPELTSEKTIEDAQKIMRQVFEKRDGRNNILQKFVKENYSVENVSKIAYARLEQIWRKIK